MLNIQRSSDSAVGDVAHWHSEDGVLHEGVVLAQQKVSDADIKVIDCKCCGHAHIVPLPSFETLKTFYETEFYEVEKTGYLSMNKEERDWLALEFSDRFECAERLLGNRSGRALDIGSGPGDFLLTGDSRGWKTLGVEPSPAASKFSREAGLEIVTGFFSEEMSSSLGSFDFVHMSEVLEHVANPHSVVKAAAGVMAPGGILCVSVPNDFNVLQETFVQQNGSEPWWVVPDHHLNYFTFSTLEKLLVNQGFALEHRTTSFPMELFLLMGLDYTKDPKLGSKLHGWRKQLDHTLAAGSNVRQKFYRALAEADLGRLSIVYARKVD